MAQFVLNRHLLIFHNAPCLSQTFCISFLLHFSRNNCNKQEIKNVMQNFGANNVHYGKCAGGELGFSAFT